MHKGNSRVRQERTIEWADAMRRNDPIAREKAFKGLDAALQEEQMIREETVALIRNELPDREPNDKDYIFVSFIMQHLPVGIIGLLIAMIFSAGMSSTSAELSALATTSTVDVLRPSADDRTQVRNTRLATIFFGLLALLFAAVFSMFENLIQAVNILGSLFYGTILGIFLVAFFLKWVKGTAVFIAALIGQAVIFIIHFSAIEIAFLWYNLIAPAIVIVISIILQAVLPSEKEKAS